MRTLLADPAGTRFVPVTRTTELAHRETLRLLRALGRLGIAAPTAIVNATAPASCRVFSATFMEEARMARALRAGPRRQPRVQNVVLAPATAPPPQGIDELLSWAHRWRRAA